MPLQVTPQLQEILLEQPEFGMGYQRFTHEGQNWLAINAQFLIETDRNWLILPHEISAIEAGALTETGYSSPGFTDSEPRLADADYPLRTWPHDPMIRVERHGSYLSMSQPNEVFYRYSAFFYDRRVRIDGSLLPGTYATTASDKPHVTSGLAAVGRYALPNPNPAVFEFAIQPVVPINIQCGTCQPNFGQSGGGVEVQLSHGTDPGSVRVPPLRIPER